MSRTTTRAAYQDVLDYASSHTDPCKLTVSELLFALQIPRSTLYRAFASHGGVNEFLLSLRLEVGKHLLVTTEDACQEVSQRCGFRSPAHFSRRFLRTNGLSPQVYRHQLGELGTPDAGLVRRGDIVGEQKPPAGSPKPSMSSRRSLRSSRALRLPATGDEQERSPAGSAASPNL